jgi:hypothetical protein
MICICIVYGKDYIDSLFERGLPSLMTSNNLPAFSAEELTLYLGTTETWMPYLRQKIRNSDIQKLFDKRIIIHFMPFTPDPNDNPFVRIEKQRKVSFSHLIRAMKFCIERDETFFAISPDFMYSDGFVEVNWELHRLTRKVIANFSMRLTSVPGGTEYFREMLNRPFGVKELCFRFPEERWRDQMTDDPDYLPGETTGHQTFTGKHNMHVFSANPNPTMGKFTESDLFFFLEAGTFNDWDHEWLTRLTDEKRLLVQTNMDLGMSVEARVGDQDAGYAELSREVEKTRGVGRAISERREHFLGDDKDKFDVIEVVRKQRFGTPLSLYCFSTRVP